MTELSMACSTNRHLLKGLTQVRAQSLQVRELVKRDD